MLRTPQGNKDNRACAMKPSAAILIIDFTVRDWDRSCYVIRIKKYPYLASTRFQIHIGFKNIHSGERIQKAFGFASEFTGYVWMKGVSGKKKLRIQKYEDTCERDLKTTRTL